MDTPARTHNDYPILSVQGPRILAKLNKKYAPQCKRKLLINVISVSIILLDKCFLLKLFNEFYNFSLTLKKSIFK